MGANEVGTGPATLSDVLDRLDLMESQLIEVGDMLRRAMELVDAFEQMASGPMGAMLGAAGPGALLGGGPPAPKPKAVQDALDRVKGRS